MALSFHASATSTGADITVPATAQAGDLAILFQQATGAADPTGVNPTGWTQIYQNGGSGSPVSRWIVSRKILVSGDVGATVTGMDGSTLDNKIMLVFRGTNPITAVTVVQGSNFDSSNTDPAISTVTASGGAAPLVVLGFAAVNDAAATFSTASPAFDAQQTVGNIRTGYKIYNSSPADHTIDKGDEGGRNHVAGFYITVIEQVSLVATAPTLAFAALPTPALTGKHTVVATAPTLAFAALPTPALTGKHTVVATPPTLAWPTWPTPALTGKHTLTATALSLSWGTWPTPVYTQVFVIVAAGVNDAVYGADALVFGSGWSENDAGTNITLPGANMVLAPNGSLFTNNYAYKQFSCSPGTWKITVQKTPSGDDIAIRVGTAAGDGTYYNSGAAGVGAGVTTFTVEFTIPTAVTTAYFSIQAFGSAGTVTVSDIDVQKLMSGVMVWPTWPTPELTGKHSLVATPPTYAFAALPAPALTGKHTLIATPPTLAWPTWPTPPLVIVFHFVATPPTLAWPTWPTPVLTGKHTLVATPPTRAWGTWPTPVLTGKHTLVATPPTRAWGAWPTPALTGKHTVVAVSVIFGPHVLPTPRARTGRFYIGESSAYRLPTVIEYGQGESYVDIAEVWYKSGGVWQQLYK